MWLPECGFVHTARCLHGPCHSVDQYPGSFYSGMLRRLDVLHCVHPPSTWHGFGLFFFFAVVNGAATNICVQAFSACFQFFWVFVSRSGIAGSHGNSESNLWGTANCFLHWPLYIPDSSVWGFLYILANTCYFIYFFLSVIVNLEVWCLMFFDWHFLVDHLLCVSWPSVYLIWRNICWSPLLIQ